MRPSDRWMLTFRTSITSAVTAFMVVLAVLLIAIQARALHWATKEAASAYMDATSAKALGRLEMEIFARWKEIDFDKAIWAVPPRP
jgi:adenylate cyclase